MSIRSFVRRAVGDSVYSKLQACRRRRENQQFTQAQSARDIQVGAFRLTAPSNHILFRLQATQPYRDLAVGVLAGELARKYPGEPLVDVGANIGDTAAIIATYSPSPIIAVEPSEFYGHFLAQNLARIPNKTLVHRTLISGKPREQGVLRHAGGTARFEAIAGSESWMECKQLSDIAGNARMIKIDTDGFDLSILGASLPFLADTRPCILYENEIPNPEALVTADQLIDNLAAAGYRYFVVFHDTGLHMVSTSDTEILHQLNRFLYQARATNPECDLYNFDIMCIPATDQDIYAGVNDYYNQNLGRHSPYEVNAHGVRPPANLNG